MTCGMYNAAGDWVSAVGLPAKSGVGGGIVAVQAGHDLARIAKGAGLQNHSRVMKRSSLVGSNLTGAVHMLKRPESR